MRSNKIENNLLKLKIETTSKTKQYQFFKFLYCLEVILSSIFTKVSFSLLGTTLFLQKCIFLTILMIIYFLGFSLNIFKGSCQFFLNSNDGQCNVKWYFVLLYIRANDYLQGVWVWSQWSHRLYLGCTKDFVNNSTIKYLFEIFLQSRFDKTPKFLLWVAFSYPKEHLSFPYCL